MVKELQNNTVLITGASRGIGYYTTMLLANNGYIVFAGVRKQEDYDRLKTLNKNILPVFLDVTDEDLINNAYAFISNNCEKLYAIINNAGVSFVEPVELIANKDLKEQFDINTFAPIKIIQKFSPLIKGGKIINISSIAADLNIPFSSAYCASKKSLETFIDAYSKETFNKDINFIIIKPGTINTEIWTKSKEKFQGTVYFNIMSLIYSIMNKFSGLFQTPEKISLLILKILKSKKTKKIYYFGIDAILIKYLKWLIRPLMEISLKILKTKAR